MKNLKKVLSVALALAMALSLMTTAFAAIPKASGLTGYDKVGTSYKEAVDVMVGLGVIDGVSGDVQAQGNVTREQAAKIICTMLMGSNASALSTTSTYFTDVPATRWSAPYIAYCLEKGIVSGVGGGKFNPAGNVTGNQFAKMLLVALGYSADIQGYTGTNWATNVSSDAVTAGIFSGNTSANKNVAATREAACLYAFNTLKANMVKYDNKGTTITIGNTNIAVGASTPSNITGMTYDYRVVGGGVGTYGDTQQFCEKYFYDADATGSKLVYTTSDDSMNRPAHNWFYGAAQTSATQIGSYKATPIATYTAKTSDATILTAMGLNANTTIAQCTNGGAYGDQALTAAAQTYANGTANGAVVEIYKVDTTVSGNTRAYRECITQYTFGPATVKSVAATSSKGAYTDYKVGSTDYYVFSTVVTSADVNTAVVTGTVANGDKVVYYVDKNLVAHIFAIDTTSGILTSITSAGVYTIGGTAMKMSAASGNTPPSISTKSQTLYVDNYGYILGAKTSTSLDYGFVLKTDTSYSQNTDGTLSPAFVAIMAFPDGTVKNVYTVDASGYAKNYGGTFTDGTKSYGVVTYTVNSDGKYVLTPILVSTDDDLVTAVTAYAYNSNLLTDATNSETMYANGSTLFVYAGYKADGTTLSGTVTTQTGIANVGSASATTAYAVDTDAVKDGVANVVFVYNNVNATATNSYVYLTGSYTQTASGATKNTYAMNAIKNGEATTITVVLSAADLTTALGSATALQKGLKTSVTVTNGAAVSVVNAPLTDVTGMKVSGGLLYTTDAAGGDSAFAVTTKTTGSVVYVANTIPVYEINSTTGTCTTTNAGDLTTSVAGAVNVQYAATGAISAIYVIHA